MVHSISCNEGTMILLWLISIMDLQIFQFLRLKNPIILIGIKLKFNITSDRAFKALNISIVTSTDKLSVEAFYLPHEKYKHGSFEKSYLSKLAT